MRDLTFFLHFSQLAGSHLRKLIMAMVTKKPESTRRRIRLIHCTIGPDLAKAVSDPSHVALSSLLLAAQSQGCQRAPRFFSVVIFDFGGYTRVDAHLVHV